MLFFWISSCPFSEHTEWNYTISRNHQPPASAFQNQKECRALKSRLLWGGDQAIYQNPRKVFGPRKGFFPSIFNDSRVFLCKVESRPGYLSILQRWKITNLENAVCVAWHYNCDESVFSTHDGFSSSKYYSGRWKQSVFTNVKDVCIACLVIHRRTEKFRMFTRFSEIRILWKLTVACTGDCFR